MSAIGLNLGCHGNTCDQHLTDISAHIRGRHIDPIGYDAAKKIKGKKRHLIVDTLGLMLGLDVTPADVQDRDGFLPLLTNVRRMFVFLERLFANGAYSGTETAATVKRVGKVKLEVIRRSDAAK